MSLSSVEDIYNSVSGIKSTAHFGFMTFGVNLHSSFFRVYYRWSTTLHSFFKHHLAPCTMFNRLVPKVHDPSSLLFYIGVLNTILLHNAQEFKGYILHFTKGYSKVFTEYLTIMMTLMRKKMLRQMMMRTGTPRNQSLLPLFIQHSSFSKV